VKQTESEKNMHTLLVRYPPSVAGCACITLPTTATVGDAVDAALARAGAF